MTANTVPEDGWEPPAWLSGPRYSTRELMWLCERLDASNRQLRIVNRQLAEQLNRKEDQ